MYIYLSRNNSVATLLLFRCEHNSEDNASDEFSVLWTSRWWFVIHFHTAFLLFWCEQNTEDNKAERFQSLPYSLPNPQPQSYLSRTFLFYIEPKFHFIFIVISEANPRQIILIIALIPQYYAYGDKFISCSCVCYFVYMYSHIKYIIDLPLFCNSAVISWMILN